MVTVDKKTNEEIKGYLKNLPKLADKGKDKRVERAKNNFYYCVQTYFPHHIDFSKKETSEFRKWVYNCLPTLIIGKDRPVKIDTSAYRGGAKTTTISKLLSLWRTARNDYCYEVILSSTIDIACEVLETIKIELEDNTAFRTDFNIALSTPWTSDEIVFTVNNKKIKIRAAGAGKKIRGLNFLGKRPDFIVVDDIENDENVESVTQRNKLKKWFNGAVLKLPDRAKPYTLIMVGTLLHHDSLLAHVRTRSDFLHFDFPLVLKMPENIDILTQDNLYSFNFNSCILDDTRINPVDIFSDYLADRTSFYSEYQNKPLSTDDLIFHNYKTFSTMPACDTYAIGVDPSLGKSKGDYFAIALLGYKKDEKRFYLSAQGYKVTPEKMIPLLIKKYLSLLKAGQYVKIAIETVQFQEFFADTLKKEAKAKGIILPVVELKNSVAKELRIDSLSPHLNDGTILVDENSHLLIDELMTYPKAAHDDLLDAAEMAWRIMSRATGMNHKAVKKAFKNANFEKRNFFE